MWVGNIYDVVKIMLIWTLFIWERPSAYG